jgi:hypothetical protein
MGETSVNQSSTDTRALQRVINRHAPQLYGRQRRIMWPGGMNPCRRCDDDAVSSCTNVHGGRQIVAVVDRCRCRCATAQHGDSQCLYVGEPEAFDNGVT